jgi:hypothetical protein
MRIALRLAVWLGVGLLTIWAMAALFVDVRMQVLRIPTLLAYIVVLIAIFRSTRQPYRRALLSMAVFCVVLIWWLALKPRNIADWQPNVDRVGSVEIDGDRLLLHNVRNCDYRSEFEYDSCWSDRTVFLSQLKSADLFFTNWGPKYIGHPIVSFQFGDHDHIAFSIEARYKLGQTYSAILGFFRQYELIFVMADERDVVRLRTNYRKGEEVYLYRLQLPPETVHAIFLIYADYLNKLKDHPEWYNALTRNCTTSVDRQIAAEMANPQPWNYQILLNGTLDHLLYQRGRLVTGGLPFPDLRQQAHINAAAEQAGTSTDFSQQIRVGRVGFSEGTSVLQILPPPID